MKKSYIFLLLALVFVSACTGQSVKVDANNGLKINEFSTDTPIAEQTVRASRSTVSPSKSK